mmetsp:Transcript_92252/g.265453  ORF Transcript_92252/g.265453 Transcript_92252/m.265453 type:complete len:224 (-) Transcript_92252:890-1561(-)
MRSRRSHHEPQYALSCSAQADRADGRSALAFPKLRLRRSWNQALAVGRVQTPPRRRQRRRGLCSLGVAGVALIAIQVAVRGAASDQLSPPARSSSHGAWLPLLIGLGNTAAVAGHSVIPKSLCHIVARGRRRCVQRSRVKGPRVVRPWRRAHEIGFALFGMARLGTVRQFLVVAWLGLQGALARPMHGLRRRELLFPWAVLRCGLVRPEPGRLAPQARAREFA